MIGYKKIQKVIEQLNKYSIDKLFKNEKDMIKWIKSLNKNEIASILSLDVDPKLIKFDLELLINKNLLNTDDYNKKVQALASIENADGYYHLFDRMLTVDFLNSNKFYSDIEKVKKVSCPQTLLWIIGDPVFVNSPFHDEDLDILINYKDERGTEYNYIMMQAIATTAKCDASIQSPYHQSDINMYLEYGNEALQFYNSYPERGINNLGINEISLKDNYHMDNMKILASNKEIGNFLYAVMTDDTFIHSPNYRRLINKMIENKKNKEYVFLLCVYAIGEEKASIACNITDNYAREYMLHSRKELLMEIIEEELKIDDGNCNNKQEKIIRDSINGALLNTIGMTYGEYEKLDLYEQQNIMNQYSKKMSKENVINVSENIDELKEKLDFKTWLYLFITNVIRVDHIPVIQVQDKRIMYIKQDKNNAVYVFKNYEEYRNFYLMYLDDIEDDLIDLAIYTKGSKGQIVALKGLCEHIIVKKKVNDFYTLITQEQIDETHLKNKISPLEAVQLWKLYDLYIEANKELSSHNTCDYFGYKCHECLIEPVSPSVEHESIDMQKNITNKKLVYSKDRIQ